MSPPIRVLLVEDHAIVREGIRELLGREPTIQVIGAAADGEGGVDLAARLAPDVVLMDLVLPGLSGVEAIQRIRAGSNPSRVLVLSAYGDEASIRASFAAGAIGFMPKAVSADELVAAIHAVAGGAIVLHPAAAGAVLRQNGPPDVRRAITGREVVILQYAARGARTKEIAEALGVSTRTIEAEFTTIFSKLGVTNRAEAVADAVSHNWLMKGEAQAIDAVPARTAAPLGDGDGATIA